jgi:hypothetical protein
MLRSIALIVAVGLVGTVQAGEKIYVCDALSVSELNESGALEQTNFAKAIAMYESRFAVDRETGVAVGGPFGTWDAKDVQVLSSGTDKEAFKVLWLANAPYAHFKYLLVKSYSEGEKKPFLGLTGNAVITGLCE